MFEEQLTSLLASYLGQILDIQQDQLNVNVWTAWKSGLTLEDVPLRHGVSLMPGVILVGGKIGLLQISVPWGSLMRLTSTQMVVSLKDVEIVLGLEEDVEGVVARERYRMEKQHLLAAQQLKHMAEESMNTSKGMMYSFIKHALSLVLGRLRVMVENVTVRVVDIAGTVDVVRFHMDTMETVDKAFLFHFNDTKTYRIGTEREESIVDLADGVLRHGASKNIRFSRVSVSLYGSDSHLVDTDFNVKILYDIMSPQSQILVTMECETCTSAVDMDCVGRLMDDMEKAEWTAVRRQVAHLKPDSSFDAKEMWRFAVHSVLLKLLGPLKFSVWKTDKERVHDRRRYTLLYRKKIEREKNHQHRNFVAVGDDDTPTSTSSSAVQRQQALLSSTGEEQLSLLEETMSVSDILACRSAAKTSLMRSNSSNFEIVDVQRKDGVATESCWMKIPTLADMEDLFQTFDFTPDTDVEDASGLSFDIQILSMIRIPRIECRVYSSIHDLDMSLTCVNLAGGHVNNLGGNTYAMASMHTFSITTPRGSSIHPPVESRGPCMTVHYNGEKTVLDVDMSNGLCACAVLSDIDSLMKSLPVPSSNAYSLHWMHSAVEMEKFAYCLETIERLEHVGHFLNMTLALGQTEVSLGDFEISLESANVCSAAESDTLIEIRRIYGIMRSFVSSCGGGGDGQRSRDVLRECIHSLEDRLLYKTMDVSIRTLRILHDGYVILQPLDGTLGIKLNRLFGDFSHPQMMVDFSSGSLVLGMYTAALESLIDVQSSFTSSQYVPEDARVDETMSICMHWPRMYVRWLDDRFDTTQCSLGSGKGSVRVRTSSIQTSKEIHASIDGIELLHANGMKNIDIPLAECSIPYVARMVSLESLGVDVIQLPGSTKASMNIEGLSLIGDEKDCSNFIRRRKVNEASSIAVGYVETQDEGISLDVSVSNIDMGHGTVIRSSIVSHIFSPNEDASQEMDVPKRMAVNVVCNDLRCSFVHDCQYDLIRGLPVQYQEFSKVHSTISTVDVDGARALFYIGERMSLNCFAFESLRICCGFLGEQGASMSAIFEVPLVDGDMDGRLLLLHCPSIQFAIHPHQILLLKGVSDLLEHEKTSLTEFYGSLTMGEVDRPSQTHPLRFDPISLNIGVLRLGIFGALPSAGAMCLQCCSILVDVGPGSVQISWGSLGLLLYRNQNTHDSSDSDSISDGSSVCHSANFMNQWISPGLSRKASSVFLDTASVTSRGLSESSCVSRYYSVAGDSLSNVSRHDEGIYSEKDGLGLCFFENEQASLVIDVQCKGIDAMQRAASFDLGEKQATMTLSPIWIRVDLNNVAQSAQFFHTYTQYVSEHIQNKPTAEEPRSRQIFLREFVLDLRGVAIALEAQDTGHFCSGTHGDRSSENSFDNHATNPLDIPVYTIEVSFRSYLQLTSGNVGQKCLAKIMGLSVHSFTGAKCADINIYSILGNQEIVLNSNWKEKTGEATTFKNDVTCGHLSVWLHDENLAPTAKVISQLNSCLELFQKKIEPDVEAFGDFLLVQTPNTAQVTVMICMDKLSVLFSQKSLSDQLVHLSEICVNSISFVTHYVDGTVHGSASLSIEAATSNVAEGTWMTIMDDTNIKCQFVLPDFSNAQRQVSDMVRVDFGIQDLNLTVDSNVINSLYVSQLMIDQVLHAEQDGNPASFVTHGEIHNNTECTLDLIIQESEGNIRDRYILKPGSRIFPRQKQSFPYKSGCPDSVNGVSNSPVPKRFDASTTYTLYYKISGSQEELIGPIRMRDTGSQHHDVTFGGQRCILVSHTARDQIGTWKTSISSGVKFLNNTNIDIKVKYQKEAADEEEIFVSTRQEQMWLPISAGRGYYRFKLGEHTHSGTHSDIFNSDEWSKGIYLDPEQIDGDCLQSEIACMFEGSKVTLALSVQKKDDWLIVTASPIFGIENFLPMPILVSSQVGPAVNIESTQSIMTHLTVFPLILCVEPAGFSATKSVYLDTSTTSPYIKWLDQDIDDFSQVLDVNFRENAHGKNEMYAQIHVLKDQSTGTIMLRVVSPIWIYNYSGVSMSLDCLLDPDSMSQMQMMLDGQDVVLDDVVPEAWISPLDLAESPSSISARSLCSSSYVSEQSLEGMDTDAAVSSRRHGTTHGSLVDGTCQASHGAVMGLGSLAVEQSGENMDSDSEGTWNVIGHSFSGLISPNYKSPLKTSSSLPSGPNSYGFRILNHATKKFRLRFSRQKARPGSTYWSSDVALDEQHSFEAIEVPLSPLLPGIHAEYSQGAYPIIVDLQRISSSDDCVQRLVVSPKYVIVNQLNCVIQYKQQGTPVDFRVFPGGFTPVQWTDIRLPKKISIRIQQAGWMWSGGFSLDHVGDLFLKLRHRDRGITRIVRADVSRISDHGTEKIVLRSSPEDFAPYRLENCSLETLMVHQRGVLDQQDVLKPYCSLNYTWDEPSLAHKITVECPGGVRVGTFDLDSVGFVSSVKMKDKSRGKSTTLGIFIHAEGPLKVLTVFNQEYHNIPRLLEEKIPDTRRNSAFEFKCTLQAFSISCIHNNQESLFFILERFSLSCFVSSSRIDISGNFKAMKIDNTSMSCVYPVVFALPAPESKLTSRVRRGVEAKTGIANPVNWEISLWRKGPENDIICFDLAEINIRSFGIYIEQDLLNIIGELLDTRSLILKAEPIAPKPLLQLPSVLNVSTLQQQSSKRSLEKYYFDRIGISPMEVTISFNSSIEKHWNKILLQQVLALADIEDARLWLSGIMLKNALFDRKSMFSHVANHYKRSILLEIFKVLGAANVLGDPMAFLQHISFGFWEFLSFPAIGLLESLRNMTPSGFILGLVQGTKGLLQNILFAISNAATKASSAAHKAILLWGYGTMNPSLPQVTPSFIDIMADRDRSEESLVAATLRGLIGLVTDPIKGAEEGGLSGFLGGIRHGAFGAILIPTSAWLQMCASTALSIRKSVAGSANIGWSRPPRWISPENGALPYDRNEAMGRWLFFQMKRNWNELVHLDEYVYCSRMVCTGKEAEEYIILTTKAVLVVRACGINWIPQLLWRSKIRMIEAVKIVKSSIMIISNPELIRKSIMRLKEDTQTLYSVYSAAFVSEDDAKAMFMHIEDERKESPPFIGCQVKFDM